MLSVCIVFQEGVKDAYGSLDIATMPDPKPARCCVTVPELGLGAKVSHCGLHLGFYLSANKVSRLRSNALRSREVQCKLSISIDLILSRPSADKFLSGVKQSLSIGVVWRMYASKLE